MPDIDIDFCIEGRETVINYVRDKYGHDKVCQIITFGTMMAKGVLKDVARALGIPFEDSNALTDLIPDQLKITLTEACEQEPRLQELRESNPRIAHLFDIALRLEGITRHASKHAAGIVISPEPIREVLPIYIPPKTTDLVTQYAMTELEALGFLKMDFLGLKNLTLIKQALDLIEKNHAIAIDIIKIPLDDAPTFALICRGGTSGVFQLESDGLKEVLRRLKPSKFEDIIAVNALYRPGPLGSGMVEDFIERRHGRQKITYVFEELKEILEETYGVIVYQEQVMKIASAIAGYSLGESDILRRAMGKKKADVMAEQKEIFAKRAEDRNFNRKKAETLFDLIAYFAGYGFNKSHSAAYALIAYQTAYLKANYPAEFMACLISLEAHDTEKMAFYISEAKDEHLSVLLPDINASEINFSTDTEGTNIRFGLQGIKNVGIIALRKILEERTKRPFNDMLDFCNRVDLRTANKRVIESLICAGAFDQLPGNRAQKMAELSKIMDIATEQKEAAITGQMGLFEAPRVDTHGAHATYTFQALAEWPERDKLEKEKEVIGVYVSAQPLDRYKQFIDSIQAIPFNQAGKQNGAVICCGLLKSCKVIVTKKGDKMAFATLEDYSGKSEVIIFPKVYKIAASWLETYTTFAIKGVVDEPSEVSCKIKAQEIIPFDLMAQGTGVMAVTITIPENSPEEVMSAFKNALKQGTIPLSLNFTENNKPLKLNTRIKIMLDEPLLEFIKTHNLGLHIGL
jgi:DNA-directed DNA polymerase III (polc)